MKFTYYGHACFLIETQGKKLLFDPFITGNPLADTLNIMDIKADYILITHGHQDHVLDVEAIAKNTGALLISNYEIISWFSNKGLSGHPLNHGGKHVFDFGTVKYVSAIHSSVLPDGTNGGNPGGFVVWNTTDCFYVSGDTALTYDMKLIPALCPPLKAAVLPIGDNFTMGKEEALMASDFIKCPTIVGCHYNTFPPIAIEPEEVRQYFAQNDKTLLLPKIGESLSL
jgi:L-ascorbate metabolism protein UlaG (beta-lactamase superfamily)